MTELPSGLKEKDIEMLFKGFNKKPVYCGDCEYNKERTYRGCIHRCLKLILESDAENVVRKVLWNQHKEFEGKVEQLKKELYRIAEATIIQKNGDYTWFDEDDLDKELDKIVDEVFGCEKPTKDEVSVKCHMGISSVVGSQNHFDMAIDCMVCGKQIGFRGFCGKECHDKYYDELCSSADAKQEARKC